MSWQIPSQGQWGPGPGMNMTPDMNMGSYTPDQWAAMQHQNWQQWAQWQQQYAQWQSQYGEKYAQQMQAMQSMGHMPSMPPLPPTKAPVPAPPPPDKPPPPPHENNQPLYGALQTKATPSPVPPPTHNRANTNPTTTNTTAGNVFRSHDGDSAPSNVNSEALKKLAEEESLFDIQFKKWEEEIDKWRQENVNHPDKEAYKEYEQKFEACRAQLMERRQQMKQKRARLMGFTPPANIPASNAPMPPTPMPPTSMPPPPISNINVSQQKYHKQQEQQQQYNQNAYQQNQQFHNPTATSTYNKVNIDTQDIYESYEDIHNYSAGKSNLQSENSNFLATGASNKGIPGLDLVHETEKPTIGQQDVIEITEDNGQKYQKSQAPDYTTISKGINNILGDEKIMNILSRVVIPPHANSPTQNALSHNSGNGNQFNNQTNQMQNQWDRPNNQQFGNRHDNMTYSNRQEPNYSQPPPNQGQQNRYPPPQNQYQNQYHNQGEHQNQFDQNQHQNPNQHQRHNQNQYPNQNQNRMFNERQPNIQNQYDENSQYRGQDSMPQRCNQPPPNQNTQAPKSLMDLNIKHPGINNYSRPPPSNMMDRHPLTENIPPSIPPKPMWIEDPMFTPSLIVEYEHKPLRLKARDFIEPVHMFDYNHISKDGENKKKDFEREGDELFSRKPRREREHDFYSQDRYARDLHSKDYERRVPREEPRDSYNYRPPRDEYEDRRRAEDRYEERRRDDRYTRRDDFHRDRERERDRDKDLYRDRFRDAVRREERPRSGSRERDSRKRDHSKERHSSDVTKRTRENGGDKPEQPKHIVMIDDLLEPPGRGMRPEKIVIILRGLPGSGKSYLAKLIRDKEAEYGGTARIMSIDDYFMQEGEIEEKDSTGKVIQKPTLKYEYDESLEETYLVSLKRAFKRSLTDGYFTFLIYDAINNHLRSYADVWNMARQIGFQVYVCTMEMDPHACFKRNIHNRSLAEIQSIASSFIPTPPHHIQLDATTLLQSAAITDVHMEDADDDDDVVIMEDAQETEVESVFTSKWERVDDAAQLARLDGTSKPLRPSQLSMEDYLQLDDWTPTTARPGKKSVRWADIEERREQEKMRAIGFVVGQTDWHRMTDPTMGSSALTQTKYIERI